MTESVVVHGVRLIEMQRIVAENGTLIVGEIPATLPFIASRIFTLFDIPEGEARGIHAHRRCQQFLICMRGSVTAVIDDGVRRQEVLLDRPSLGLYMPAMTWGTQYNYSTDAMLVVLASDPYSKQDYIEDYDEFLKLVATTESEDSSHV